MRRVDAAARDDAHTVKRSAGAQGERRPPTSAQSPASGANRAPRDARPAWARGRRHAGAFSGARLALLRLTRGWNLLLVVALGMVVAVTLICAVPLYDTLIADLQLQQALQSSGSSARNIEIDLGSQHISQQAHTAPAAQVTPLAQRAIGAFTQPAPTFYAVSDEMLLDTVNARTFPPSDSHPRQVIVEAYDYANAQAHMRFIEGGPPQASAVGSNAPAQVIITSDMAQSFDAHVGSTLSITAFGDHSQTLTFRVVGVWQPLDTEDPFWNGHHFHQENSGGDLTLLPLLTTYDTFFTGLQRFPSVGMSQRWIYYTRPAQLSTANMESVRQSIGALRARLSGEALGTNGVTDIKVQTLLDQTIQGIESQQTLLALPLYVIVAQVVGLALIFVTAMAGLLIDSQAQEIATLKSRGASGFQILSGYTLQALLPALGAGVVGPFLAAFLALGLIHWFLPAETLRQASVSPTYYSAIASPSAAIIPAIIGALLGVGVVILTALQSANMDVLAFRRQQGRSSRQPFWQRYYLDLGLVALCAVGYLELNQFGAVGVRTQLTGGSASPVLLLTPALILLAGALLILRIFPLVAGWGSRLVTRGRGLTTLLAFSQVERNPARYSRMTLLLALSVGVGLFALTFDSSLARSSHDRAAYTVGADLRLVEGRTLLPSESAAITNRIRALPGIQVISPVYRTQASTTLAQTQNQVDALAIDPTTFGAVASATSWRDDYSATPLADMLAQMRANERGAQAGDSSTPLWALVSSVFAAQYHVGVGQQFTLNLEEDGFANVSFTVGAIVQNFPTLYPARLTGSFIVADLHDYLAAIGANESSPNAVPYGPNEFWLRASDSLDQQNAALTALNRPEYGAKQVLSLHTTLLATQANPAASGIRGLLLVGALTAALLAILGGIAQSTATARQRASQFAVLRTLGMKRRQLVALLLGEQVIMYLFGLIGGTLVGLTLISATLPYLQFSDQTPDPAQIGVPPYALTFNVPGSGLFYLALLLAFALALLIASQYAARVGLGKTLRLGED